MTIDLFNVPAEEFALAEAVRWMTVQYAFCAGPSENRSTLTVKAYETPIYYGFISIQDGKYEWNDQQSSIAFYLGEREAFLGNQKYWGNVSIDRKYLNAKSLHLLTILAKLVSEYLDIDGDIWHAHMGAGQGAWGELLTYRLMHKDEHGGHWTDAGLEVLKAFDDLGPFPV